MASFYAKIGWKRPGKRENKNVVPFRYHPTRNREFQKKLQKNEKNEKKPLWHHFKPTLVGKG